MPVHVNELHTDIRPADDGQPAGNGSGQMAGDAVDDLWREAHGRRRWIDARTSADAYED